VLPFTLANITTNYSEADARLEFHHENGSKTVILAHPERSTRFVLIGDGKRIKTANGFLSAFPIDLVIVPTLAPLEAEETYVTEETVQRNKNRKQAARNFRNIWLLESDERFQLFREHVEAAWGQVELSKPELVRTDKTIVQMFFTENRITREIQWAGFGFQVWLQIQTHFMRGGGDSILVIDEPDVYLHPDVQKKLLFDAGARFSQYFMATHATEIINAAKSDDILIVNSSRKSAHRIKTEKDFNSVLDYIGSSQNADFAILTKVKRALFVEGNEGKLIRRLARTLKYDALSDEQLLPSYQLGGYSNAAKLKHAAWAFENILDLKIDLYCLLDRDYRGNDEIEEFMTEAKKAGVHLWVLNRKEIENYLLVPTAMARAAERLTKVKGGLAAPSAVWFREVLDEFSEIKKSLVQSQITARYLTFARLRNRAEDDAVHVEAALQHCEELWSQFEGRVQLVPGKEALAYVNSRLQERYKVSLSALRICSEIKADELAPDLRALLGEIEAAVAE
jgi:hypothetical protein